MAYDADVSLRTSDNRPVFATFLSDIELEEVSHEETSDEKGNTRKGKCYHKKVDNISQCESTTFGRVCVLYY